MFLPEEVSCIEINNGASILPNKQLWNVIELRADGTITIKIILLRVPSNTFWEFTPYSKFVLNCT